MGTSTSVAELPSWARSLLGRERVGHLGVLAPDGTPRVLPVTYALVHGTLVSAVDQKPKSVPGERLARVRWLRARPRATLTVDHYEDDWTALAWLQVIGTVTIRDALAAPEALSALAARYAAYRELPPSGPLLVLTPERIAWWRA
jgi:PPOX class probable F420-dependent enzyme